MKYTLYEESGKGDKPISVQLVLAHNGNIRLVAVNDSGDMLPQGALLDLDKNGKIRRHATVNTGLGFALNDDGKIKISN